MPKASSPPLTSLLDRTLHADQAGHIWVAAVTGVYQLSNGTFSKLPAPPGLPFNRVTALTSDDEAAGRASASTTDVMTRVMLQAFPDDVDPAVEAAIAKVLGHVWFSCMVAWKNGVGDMTWMAGELQIAADLICGHLD